jgi:hypothetical protein
MELPTEFFDLALKIKAGFLWSIKHKDNVTEK